jgi:hypothetical protein
MFISFHEGEAAGRHFATELVTVADRDGEAAALRLAEEIVAKARRERWHPDFIDGHQLGLAVGVVDRFPTLFN